MDIPTNEPVAFISDIHANLEALSAVQNDIKRRGISRVYNLGDIVGYCADPEKCTDIALTFEKNVVGNHDAALCLLSLADNFTEPARDSVEWTRKRLSESPKSKKYWDFFSGLPARINIKYGGRLILLVHGSPLNPRDEYIEPLASYEQNYSKFFEMGFGHCKNISKDDVKKLTDYFVSTFGQRLFFRINDLCFVGHTHKAGVMVEGKDFVSAQELEDKYDLKDRERAIINVGSVGISKDTRGVATYATLIGNSVSFHRVEYDYQPTQKKISDRKVYKNNEHKDIVCGALEKDITIQVSIHETIQ